MSKDDNPKDSNNASNSNLDKNEIVKRIKELILKGLVEKEYIEFCKKYIGEDFEGYPIDNLQRIYENGKGLLNQYFITKGPSCDSEILIKLQYILHDIMYNIIIKQNKNTEKKTYELNNKLEINIKDSEIMKNNIMKEKRKINRIRKDIESIITTIISIVLAISIIPTAIAGIEKVSADYILPFLSSVILFGVIMITFVYSIYQDKLKKSTWIVLVVAIMVCSCFWGISFTATICKDFESKNEVENVNVNETGEHENNKILQKENVSDTIKQREY